MFNNGEKTGTCQRQLLRLEEENGEEMKIQLYISFDSVTKTNSSKTLHRLG